MWMMCLGGLGGLGGLGELEVADEDSEEVVERMSEGEEVAQSVDEEKQMGDMAFVSEEGENGPSSMDKSDGEGVVGGVSMDGMGWSLKHADS